MDEGALRGVLRVLHANPKATVREIASALRIRPARVVAAQRHLREEGRLLKHEVAQPNSRGALRRRQALRLAPLEPSGVPLSENEASDVPISRTSPKDLQDLRERLGWSQTTMGKRLGVSQDLVSLWERGLREIPAHIEAHLPGLTPGFEVMSPAEFKAARERSGWRPAALARRLKISQGVLYRRENGSRGNLPAEFVREVREALAEDPPHVDPVEIQVPRVVAAVEAEPGQCRTRIRARLGPDSRAVREAIERAIELRLIHDRKDSFFDAKGRPHRRWALYPSEAPAEVVVEPAFSPEDLREERARVGWTQTQLGRRLRVRQATIAGWERGRDPVNPVRVADLRAILAAEPTAPDYGAPAPAPISPSELLDERKARGWSQRELAGHLGVSTGLVGWWERGRGRPADAQLRDLHRVFAGAEPVHREGLAERRALAEKLRAELERTGWTQRKLEKKLGAGPGSVSEWLRGSAPVPRRHRARLWEMLSEAEPVSATPAVDPKAAGGLPAAREAAGWSQEKLARRLGIPRNRLGRYERGLEVMPPALLARAHELLGAAEPHASEEERSAAWAANGARLRTARKAAGWSQKQLARRMKIAPSLVSQWENGYRQITPELLAEALAVLQTAPPERPAKAAPTEAERAAAAARPAKRVADGRRLRDARTAAGRTEEELALYLDVSVPTVSMWEKGHRQIPTEQLAEALAWLEEPQTAEDPLSGLRHELLMAIAENEGQARGYYTRPRDRQGVNEALAALCAPDGPVCERPTPFIDAAGRRMVRQGLYLRAASTGSPGADQGGASDG